MKFIKIYGKFIAMFTFAILFYVVTDPDANLISFEYGGDSLIVLNILALSLLGISIIEIFPDIFILSSMGDEKDVVEKALKGDLPAAIVYFAHKMGMVAAAIIVGAVFMSFK